ncbi:peptidylprolyl isomerase [bacterium]|nr:peptidylprolyl isomerase [bacterium]
MQWPLPQYFETNVELQKLKRVYEGGKAEEVHQELAFNNPIDWAYVKRLPKEQKLKIDTWKGSIIITLDVEGAPGTVAQIAKLAENGFYNDLIWHRVIRNFVVQGGDPLGNGTGSAKGTLRSEFNMDQYREGAVGIASAGKDTESCQFFITHNYTPHLNGRYTIIGYVTEGMDVVHQLQVNDPIVSVSLVEEN